MTAGPRLLVAGAALVQTRSGVSRHNRELLPRLAQLLRSEGGDLAVLAPKDAPDLDFGPQVQIIASNVPSGPPARRALVESRELQRVLDAARAAGEPFDVVHSGHLPAPHVHGVARTQTLHDLRQLEWKGLSLLRRIMARPLLAHARLTTDVWIAVSEDMRARLVSRLHLDASRVFVAHNAADHSQVLPRQCEAGAGILCVGHLEARKNQELLLQALALDPSLPDLILVGAARGMERTRLDAVAHRLGVASRVRFLGAVTDEELKRLYATSACLVLPSHVEGFGIPVLEAQWAGLPVAVSHAGALPEVAGAEAPSFDPGDALGCARAMRSAIGTDAKALARARVRAGLVTWDRSAQEWRVALHAAVARFKG